VTPFLDERRAALEAHRAEVKDAYEWERHLATSALPDPQREKEINTYEMAITDEETRLLGPALELAVDNEKIVNEGDTYRYWAIAEGRDTFADAVGGFQKRIRALTDVVIDRSTAGIMHTADEYQDENGEIIVFDSREGFKYVLWLNHVKNPRFKLVDVPELRVSVELPKPLTLATVAVRVIHRAYDTLSPGCNNELTSVGGVCTVDLLTLPPLPKVVQGTTLRTMSPLAVDVERLPYPIPVAGAETTEVDMAYVPPLMLSYEIPDDIVLVDETPSVAWWDDDSSEWKTDGITDVSLKDRTLTYSTVKVTHHALVQSRVACAPYTRWSTRPSSTGESVIVSVTPKHERFGGRPIEIEVGEGVCALASDAEPALRSLLGVKLAPRKLLARLSKCGVHLALEDKDCAYVGIEKKDAALEAAMCEDVALLSPSFMFASSRFNRTIGSRDCMVRIAEVTDFDLTLAEDADKVFTREREAVHVMLTQSRGCTLVDAKDKIAEVPGDLTLLMNDGRDENVGHLAVAARAEGRETPLEPLKFSPTALTLLKGVASESGLDRAAKAKSALTESVRQTLLSLRVFTFA
jgi:cancer susceptibility candidate protein 1